MKIGEIFKDMIYGAGGAVATRAISAVAQGFVPSSFATNPLARPVVQVAVAVFPVRWGVKKFMGQRASDIAMLGGLISAGLEAADIYFPNIQNSLTSVLRTPLTAAPQAQLSNGQMQVAAQGAAQGAVNALAGYRGGGAGSGMGDVYDVPNSAFAGMGDVEDVPMGIFS